MGPTADVHINIYSSGLRPQYLLFCVTASEFLETNQLPFVINHLNKQGERCQKIFFFASCFVYFQVYEACTAVFALFQ